MLFVDGLELGRGRGRHKPRDHEPVDSGHRLVQRVRIFGVDNHDGVLCGWCVCVGTCVRALWVRVCGRTGSGEKKKRLRLESRLVLDRENIWTKYSRNLADRFSRNR